MQSQEQKESKQQLEVCIIIFFQEKLSETQLTLEVWLALVQVNVK